jgi:hypothetical protein
VIDDVTKLVALFVGLFVVLAAFVLPFGPVHSWRRMMDQFRGVESRRPVWPVRRPLWVRIALLDVGSRKTAINFSWVAATVAAYSFFLAMWKQVPLLGFALGAPVLAVVAWYRLSIRWMDRNDAWPEWPPGGDT